MLVKHALLLLSGWNLGGKEESLPTRLPILHIPSPDQEALAALGTTVVLTLESPPPTLIATLPNRGLSSQGRFPRKWEALSGMECERPWLRVLVPGVRGGGGGGVLTPCPPESNVHSF